jgi:hypothetical protein
MARAHPDIPGMAVDTTPDGREIVAFDGPDLRVQPLPATGSAVFAYAFSRVLTDEEREAWSAWLSYRFGIAR